MPERNQSPYDRPLSERRTPLDNDVDPDGMDSETEGEDDLRDGADGVEQRPAGQSRTSGTHGAAVPHTTPPRKRR
jgi:hypothetical protein